MARCYSQNSRFVSSDALKILFSFHIHKPLCALFVMDLPSHPPAPADLASPFIRPDTAWQQSKSAGAIAQRVLPTRRYARLFRTYLTSIVRHAHSSV